MRMPMRAVAKRREKLTTKRTAASPTIASTYGHSGCLCCSIDWSIARCEISGIVIEISVYANARQSARIPRRRSPHHMRSSLRKVGSRPRSGGSTGFARSGMRKEPSGGPASTLPRAIFLSAAARAHESGKSLAEPRRSERRVERLPRLRDLAAAQRPLAVGQRVPLRVQTLTDERELALARVELRLEPAELGIGISRLDGPRRRLLGGARQELLELDAPRRELL